MTWQSAGAGRSGESGGQRARGDNGANSFFDSFLVNEHLMMFVTRGFGRRFYPCGLLNVRSGVHTRAHAAYQHVAIVRMLAHVAHQHIIACASLPALQRRYSLKRRQKEKKKISLHTNGSFDQPVAFWRQSLVQPVAVHLHHHRTRMSGRERPPADPCVDVCV